MTSRYEVLGPLRVTRDGVDVEMPGRRQRLLLAVLLSDRNRSVSTDRLADAVWEGRPPPTAAKSLQGAISQLRRGLGVGAIETTPTGYLLRAPTGSTDVDRFEDLLERGRSQLA